MQSASVCGWLGGCVCACVRARLCIRLRQNLLLVQMYLWWSLCSLYLHACRVRVTVSDSGFYWFTCVKYFERWLTPFSDDSISCSHDHLPACLSGISDNLLLSLTNTFLFVIWHFLFELQNSCCETSPDKGFLLLHTQAAVAAIRIAWLFELSDDILEYHMANGTTIRQQIILARRPVYL